MTSELGGALREARPGRRLHVATHEVGADTTLFLVHGGGGNKEQWRFQWRALQDAGCNLVAWDALGHGASPRPSNPALCQGDELLDDARALFGRHATARNLIVAHSYGARIALALALEVPFGLTIDGLVLVGPAPLGRLGTGRLFGGLLGRLPLPLLELARPLLARGFARRAWHPDADPALVRAEQRATRGNRLSMMQAMLGHPPAVATDQLDTLGMPITVLGGEQDGIVPIAAVAELAGLLPGAELLRVERCGHQIMLEQPDATTGAIRAMLFPQRSV